MANGFYGSLSKIQKINFQFDRIFPNRTMMDQEAEFGYYIAEGGREKLDPVFNGRYVLVDYHNGDIVDKTVRIGYRDTVSNDVIPAPGLSFNSEEDGIVLNNGDLVTVIGEFDENIEYTAYKIPKLYRYPDFDQEITYNINQRDPDSLSVYERNLMIDGQQYENIGRGWDSTVWQKTYQNGKATYVMIAELNALSPAMVLAVDAPTLIPKNPYFGTDSTIDFYRMHLQPNWGIRVKRAVPLTTKKYINKVWENVTFSTDTNLYPSDFIGVYPTVDGDSESSPLAIYFNKKGLNKFISASNALETLEEEEKVSITDSNHKAKNFISFTPTGKSGKVYEGDPQRRGVLSTAIDTYELSIMLPSIGETVSKIWDLIYGENRYYNTDGLHLYYKNPDDLTDQTAKAFASEQESRGFRNIDTYWNSYQGLRSYKKVNGQKVIDHDALKTMAGIINSAHDLMGMIVRDYKVYENADIDTLNVANWDPTKIYFVNGSYYTKEKKYVWEQYIPNALVNNNDAYEQVYTLPDDVTNLDVNKKYLIDEVPDEITGLYTKQFIVGTETVNGTTRNLTSFLYRKTSEEYPSIPDSEVYDAEFEPQFRTEYNNYIKVKDSCDIVEGAVYGFVYSAPDWTPGETEDEQEENHIYYYYDTSKQYGVNTVCYIKDDAQLSAKKGIYYDLSDYADHQIDKSFYIPDAYYVKDNVTGVTRKATEATLKAIVGSSEWVDSDAGRYHFYKNAKITTGTTGATVIDPNREEKKRIEVPVDRYSYDTDSGVLTIYQNADRNDNEKIMTVSKGTYYNQQMIEFSDLQETVPIYYYASLYLCTNGSYYSLDEIFMNGLTKVTPEEVKHYESWNPSGGSMDVLTGIEPAITALQDFSDNQFFYFYGGDTILVLETLERLKTSQGKERSESLAYYQLADLGERKKFFFSRGGSYYLTVDGDYKYYPTLHLPDPTESELTVNNKPLTGEVRVLNVDFREIPLEQCRWFKPNFYYTSPNSQTKVATYTNNGTYYERIGNVIGNSEPTWPDGMEWNESVVPENGILGSKTLTWAPKKIEGLGEEFNTMYGLILKVNQILQTGNKYSRDPSTVQGIINQANDILINLKNRGYSYHSIEITDKNGETNSLIAQNPAAAIKLQSNTGTVELSINNDDVSLDLSEQYRKWVVPNGDSENDITTLSFTDGSDNTKAMISVNEDGEMNIQADSLTLTNGEMPWFTITDSGVEFDGKPLLVSESETPISFGWDDTNKIFTVYVNSVPAVQIRKQED